MAAADTATWEQRIQAGRATADAARDAVEQIIRDASAAGVKPGVIAAALGVSPSSRAAIYRVLGKQGGQPSKPPLTPVVWLRGAGRKQPTWDAVEQAMWLRGWSTTHSRSDAWYLKRGGTPVVVCDFSVGIDPLVGLVERARHNPAPAPDGDAQELLLHGETTTFPDATGLADRLAALVGAALAGALQ